MKIYFIGTMLLLSGATVALNCSTLSISPLLMSSTQAQISNPKSPTQKLFDEGMKLYNLGTGEGWRGAIAQWETTLTLAQTQGDRPLQLLTLTWLGNTHVNLGEFNQAIASYTKVLPLYQQEGDRHSQASTLMSLGQIYATLGEYQKALDYYQQSLPLWQQVSYRTGEAANLNNLGRVYNNLGKNQEAIKYYEQVLSIVREVSNQKGEIAALNNLGLSYDSLGKPQVAIQFYQEALQLGQTLNDERSQASTLNNLGFVNTNLGHLDQALNYYQRALVLWQKLGDRRGEASTLNNLGVVQAHLGDNIKALEYYQQALTIREAIGERPKEALTRYRIALALREQNQLVASLQQIETAISIIEDLRGKIENQDLRTSFFASQQDYYQFYIDLLMQLHQEQPEKGYDAQALAASERSRARSLLELLSEVNADIRAGVDPNLLAKEKQLQQQLNTWEKHRLEAFSNPNVSQKLSDIKQEVDTLLSQYRDIQAEIRRRSPHYAALTQPQPLKLGEIQQQILDENTLLLEYFLGEKKSYLWVVTNNSLNSYELAGRAKIEELAIKFRRAVTISNRRSYSSQESAISLSKLILAPAIPHLQEKRLLIVADGALQYTPLAALAAPQTNTNNPLLNVPRNTIQEYIPLIVNHEIITLPSASTLAILRKEIGKRTPAAKTLAVLADPIFANNDERVSATRSSSPLPPELEQSARELGVFFDRIPFTREEAEQITALTTKENTLKALGANANLALAISPQLSQYRIIHLATHGLANSLNPELAGLAFSLVDEQGKPQNGFLRFYEIFNLNLPADLVVLSACQTGIGQAVRGEGILGLTRGFMYAGAARVVVSLWNVDDRATAELMKNFYQEMLLEGLSPAAALRQAQIKLWQTEQWRAPYFWAAFTLQGEWR